MVDIPERPCRFCGKQFKPVRHHQEHCNPQHRKAWHAARIFMGKKMIDALDESNYDGHLFFTRLRELLDVFRKKYPDMINRHR